MTQNMYRDLERWFSLYVSRFFTDDPDFNAVIATKRDHTQGVCNETAALCNALNLSRGPRRIAATAALYLRLLRDADKLDIWRLVSEYLLESRHNPEAKKREDITVHISTAPGCSPAVIEAFQAQRFVHFKDVKSFDDYKLLTIGWVYDLNFKPSFEKVRKQRYIEKLADTLPRNGRIQSGVEEAKVYTETAIGKDSTGGYVPSAADLNR